MYNSPISISDAASMFRHNINPNERPFAQAVMKYNNKLIDEWYDTVLVNTADKRGKMASAEVWHSWTIFAEGKEIDPYLDAIDNHLPRASQEQIDYWIAFFRKPVEVIRSFGPSTVTTGWQFLTSVIRSHLAHEKKKFIYTNDSTPLEWRKNSNKHIHLARNKTLPFGLAEEEFPEMLQKVNTVMSIIIKPQAT